MGFDSRESLGEKETGARAALPIWMNIMKQAIAGKDSEHFLGQDEPQKAPPLQAAITMSAKPGTAASSSGKPGPPATLPPLVVVISTCPSITATQARSWT